MPIPEGQSCANCRFYIQSSSIPSIEGECRRYPPSDRIQFKNYGSHTYSLPVSIIVQGDYWCGEWRSISGENMVVGIEAKPGKAEEEGK